MTNRTKRIFISDIHMGDKRSTKDPNHYGWFMDNIPVLAQFLDEQLNARDVKDVVILGDLFDTWVIPVDEDPLTSFADICSNPDNKPVIDKLKALAKNVDIKLTYVPGNHDMGMNTAAISGTKQFMETTFPGIRFFCNSSVPWGRYTVGTLAAEHGNHYCLFNAPDMWTTTGSFLPLGYFISRIVAYKVSKTGTSEDYYDILVRFLKDFMKDPDFVKDIFEAIVKDAGLNPDAIVKLNNVPGYPPDTLTTDGIGKLFGNLTQNWTCAPVHVPVLVATQEDAFEDLSSAASLAYFNQLDSNVNIVIFGHTHHPDLVPRDLNPQADPTAHASDDPWHYIYANCGSWVDERWVDKGVNVCTYVETEEDANSGLHYVRLKSYTKDTVTLIKEEFVKL